MTVRRMGVLSLTALSLLLVGGGAEAQEETAAEILEAMDAYTGLWRSDRKTGPDENSFHFEYTLTWMDPGQTIARMVIRRIGPGDASEVVFEGFKGREPDGSGVYYVAASPSGRGSRGEVLREGDTLVTRYEGWTAEGDVVEIRDVFEPVADGSYVSRTYLRDGSGAGWRRVARDVWTRVGAR